MQADCLQVALSCYTSCLPLGRRRGGHCLGGGFAVSGTGRGQCSVPAAWQQQSSRQRLCRHVCRRGLECFKPIWLTASPCRRGAVMQELQLGTHSLHPESGPALLSCLAHSPPPCCRRAVLQELQQGRQRAQERHHAQGSGGGGRRPFGEAAAGARRRNRHRPDRPWRQPRAEVSSRG